MSRMTSGLFHYKTDNFVVLSENDIRKYTSATKLGSMLYKSTWDLLKLIHKMLLNAEVSLEDQEGSEILLGTVGKKPAPALTSSDLMHSLLEIRSHINDVSKLCEIYARYPELLQ